MLNSKLITEVKIQAAVRETVKHRDTTNMTTTSNQHRGTEIDWESVYAGILQLQNECKVSLLEMYRLVVSL